MQSFRQRAFHVGAVCAMILCALCVVFGCQSTSPSESAPNENVSSTPTRHVSEQALARADSYVKALDKKTLDVSAADAQLTPTGEQKPEKKRYTLMVYMVGSNLETAYSSATKDITEMLESGVDFSQVNIIVYAGGSKRWNMDIPAGCNSVLDLSRPENERIVAQTKTEVSMGAPETLASFIEFCAKQYPASHNALIFWDHGSGPLWGFGHDELNNGDGLLLQELQKAMESGPYASTTKKKLDWVGFDACLMGSVENAALWKDYANYLIASEELEPGDGWDYSFLPELAKDADTETIANAVIDSFARHYEQAANSFSNPDVTLACYDLSKTEPVVTALDNLMSAMTDSIADGGYGDISRARRASKAFGLTSAGGRASALDLVDLGDFAEHIQGKFPDETAALKDSLSHMVVRSHSNVDHVNGVSLYIPGDNLELYETYCQLETLGSDQSPDKAADPGTSTTATGNSDAPANSSAKYEALEPSHLSATHNAFIDSLANEWMSASKVDWSLNDVSTSSDGLSLQLTEDQANALSSASFTLFTYETPGQYTLQTADIAIQLDDSGTLHVPADPLAITVKTDIGHESLAHFAQVEKVDGKEVYVNSYLSLDAAGDFESNKATNEKFSISVQVDSSSNDVSIGSIRIDDDSVGVGGKNTVDVSNYSHVYEPIFNAQPSFDANGNILPWDEWGFASSGGYYMPIEDGFGFSAHPISHFGGKWACQIVLTDVNGNRYALEPVDLLVQESEDEATVERETDLGKMEFKVEEDHAELVKYTGDDWTVEIPTDIDGVPVTIIGNSAFYNCTYLDELSIPEGITSIGQSAFAHTGLYSLTLPASLSHVAPAAFRQMPYLEKFNLAKGNKAFTVVDGVLFTADKKTLISYPNAKGTRYTVPQGVEAIGYGAFAESDIEEIVFPDGLKDIDRAAFFGCKGMKQLQLPESLEYIGVLAFGRDMIYETDLAEIGQIRIGPNVKRIGARAFNGLQLNAIEVDPGNQYYTSKDGALLNAAGDTLIELPWGNGSVFVVPEGVVALDSYAFSDYSYTKAYDFVLPSSLERCEPTCFPSKQGDNDDERIYSCIIHAADGSYAQRFADEYDIEYDTNTDVDSLRHTSVNVEQAGYTLTFSVYRDHAILTGMEAAENGPYERTLALPSEVSDVPVTGMNVTDGAWPLETLVLPETLETIGGDGLSAFTGLKRIEFEGKNDHFQLVDGALLTGDGKTLIGYPHGWEGDYAIPADVEIISARAFEGCNLEQIVLPPKVRKIGNSAFRSCENLKTVEFGKGLRSIGDQAFYDCKNLMVESAFPDSLDEIGTLAFCGIKSFEGLALPSGIERIESAAFSKKPYEDYTGELLPMSSDSLAIGSHLEQWGDTMGWGSSSASIGVDFKQFDVDEANETYQGQGPFLLSKDGITVVGFADGFEGEAHVPERVRSLNGSLFIEASKVTDLYIPDSVAAITWPQTDAESKYKNALDSITVHVKAGSYAERFAKERGLPWVVE